MYPNMQMPLDKTVTVPPVFRENIVRQLQDEMSRCGGIGKSPVEVEQYIYDTIHSKEEYLEKIGKMLLALQQKQQQQQQAQQQQQQQQMPQQTMAPGGQVQYGVRQFQPQVQGQYVQYQQHPQPGQQPAAVLIHTGQGQVAPAQIIRQQAFRQLPPDHVVTMQGQAQFRPTSRPGVMQAQQQGQQIVTHNAMIAQQPRQQFPPGQTVLMAQQPPQQPNMVMNQASNIVIGSKVQQAAANAQQQRRPQPQQQARPAPEPQQQPPQSQIVYAAKIEQQQQQKFFQQQQQQQQQQQAQFQAQQQQQGPPPQILQQQAGFPPTPQAQQLAALQQQAQQQFVAMPTQQAPPQQPQQTPLPRNSRSFNTGIASPAVAVPPPPTGPSPLGPKSGPGSVGPAMSPAIGPSSQMAPQIPTPQQSMPVPPPIEQPPQQPEPQFTEMKPNIVQQDQSRPPAPPNVTAQSQSSTPEEIAEKLKQLAKYKEPLRMLIETYEGHKDNASTTNKMKRILDIISGQSCENMAILRKCEEACIQVVSRYCPEPSVNQIFSNALSKVAVAAENIAIQQPNVAKSAPDAFSCIASKAFSGVAIDSTDIDMADLGEEWNARLQSVSRPVPTENLSETSAPIFRQFAHLSRAAQRELLFLSEKYAISCHPNSAQGGGVPAEGAADLDDLVAVDFVPTLRCLTDAGAPSICMLISPDYPESPDVPQVVFSPASELNNRLAAIKRKFTQMYESVKVASVSDVSIIRLITFFEASVLCESS